MEEYWWYFYVRCLHITFPTKTKWALFNLWLTGKRSSATAFKLTELEEGPEVLEQPWCPQSTTLTIKLLTHESETSISSMMQQPQTAGKNFSRNTRTLQHRREEPVVAKLCLLVSHSSNTYFLYSVLNLDLSLYSTTICLLSKKLWNNSFLNESNVMPTYSIVCICNSRKNKY